MAWWTAMMSNIIVSDHIRFSEEESVLYHLKMESFLKGKGRYWRLIRKVRVNKLINGWVKIQPNPSFIVR